MLLRRALALAGAVTAAAFSACDVPLAPRWDADWYLPLSTEAIHLDSTFTGGFIPPATPANVSFDPQRQDVTGAIGDVLKNLVTDSARARATITLTIAKRTAISADDTLFVAPDSSSLTNPNPGRIVFPVALATTDTLKTDTLAVGLASITMMHDAAEAKTPLWIQVRGRVSNPSGSAIAITAADSITIKLTVTARVTVSR